MTTTERPIEECVVELLGHLGIERAHFAAGGAPTLTDWHGLATRYPERIASLTVVSPPILDGGELAAVASRLLVVAGDQADTGQGAVRLASDLPDVSLHSLGGYEAQPWADVAADRGDELTAAMFAFLDRHAATPIALSEAAGEAAGISYRIRGAGPPLVLTPLMLAPSQWEPVLPALAAKYCTINLGGPRLGVVSTLEARGRSAYLTVVRNVLDVVAIRPGETVLEVGGGSGVVLREIARRTGRASRIIDVDVNPYLLREAGALTEQAGFAGCIEFHQGSAEAIPLADGSVDVALSFTVLEEGDADRTGTGNAARRPCRRHRPRGRHAGLGKRAAQCRHPCQGRTAARDGQRRRSCRRVWRPEPLPPYARRWVDGANLLPAIRRPEPGRDGPADDRQTAHHCVADCG